MDTEFSLRPENALIRNMSTVSEEFRHRITSVWGEKGRQWYRGE
jgi:hypothetical protein